jgi:hypothetical protein
MKALGGAAVHLNILRVSSTSIDIVDSMVIDYPCIISIDCYKKKCYCIQDAISSILFILPIYNFYFWSVNLDSEIYMYILRETQ